MNYKTYSSEGFVIGRRSFKEADRILTLFTKTQGKIVVIAKGSRKLTSRKRGGIEIFNKIKFSAIESKNSFDILSEIEILESFENIRKDLKKLTVAYYFCEVISKTTQEAEKHFEIYEILNKYFQELEFSKNLKQLRLNFVKEILINLGFWAFDKPMDNPDAVLENVTERQINSSKIGKRMLRPD
ncbi:MAG TPA: DNA repair protein RecO [Patescibacteria group bacterium]|nr:DNA repair protein RecO [Patescibacteria group bacterium]